jgi:hypothetical protein
MSSTGFDILRHKHQAWASLITELETEFAKTLHEDPNSVFDGDILTQQLHVDRHSVFVLLLELVAQQELRRMYFWVCSQGRGSAMESEDLTAFPDWIECDRCGTVHYFSQDEIEIHFLPSDSLRSRLLTGR